MFTLLRRGRDSLARRLGYVPQSALDEAVAAAEGRLHARLAELEQALQHKNRNLTHQVTLQAHMESEIGFLRTLQLARDQQNADTASAISRLDGVAQTLVAALKRTWPELELPDYDHTELAGTTPTG
jgi:DNA repair exonuclease SbcCD ATPase subunit